MQQRNTQSGTMTGSVLSVLVSVVAILLMAGHGFDFGAVLSAL